MTLILSMAKVMKSHILWMTFSLISFLLIFLVKIALCWKIILRISRSDLFFGYLYFYYFWIFIWIWLFFLFYLAILGQSWSWTGLSPIFAKSLLLGLYIFLIFHIISLILLFRFYLLQMKPGDRRAWLLVLVDLLYFWLFLLTLTIDLLLILDSDNIWCLQFLFLLIKAHKLSTTLLLIDSCVLWVDCLLIGIFSQINVYINHLIFHILVVPICWPVNYGPHSFLWARVSPFWIFGWVWRCV